MMTIFLPSSPKFLLGVATLLTSFQSVMMTPPKSIDGSIHFYRFPVLFPPNFPKLPDDLNLLYNGSSGNGVVGYRWHIEGLPTISRCGVSRKTAQQYCLDGQRLVSTFGQYGSADKLEYKLETGYTYHAIIAHGSKGSHPDYFEVVKKDSKILTFGNSSNSRLIARNQVAAFSWLLDSVTDKDTRVILTYDSTANYRYLRSISYQNMAVEFSYTYRKDKLTKYFMADILYQTDKILSMVTAYTDKQRGSVYAVQSLTHVPAGSAGLSLLSRIDSVFDASLRPESTIFTYNGAADVIGNDSFEKPYYLSNDFRRAGGWDKGQLRLLTDVSGDGLKDIVGFGSDDVWMAINGPTMNVYGPAFPLKLTKFSQSVAHVAGHNERHVIDLNGDGFKDILGFVDEGVFVSTYINDKTRGMYNDARRWSNENFELGPKYVKDINGDGLPDVFCYGNTSVTIALNTGGSFEKARVVSEDLTATKGWNMSKYPRFLEDVNGDKLPDMVGFGDFGIFVILNKDSQTFIPHAGKWNAKFNQATYHTSASQPRYLADVNGDGLPDAVGFSGSGVMVGLNTGSSFKGHKQWYDGFGDSKAEYLRVLHDMNGDGLPDVVGFDCCGVRVALNTGFSFAKESRWSAEYGWDNGWGSEDYPRFVTDMNGDGVADLVGFDDKGVLLSLNKNRRISLQSVDQGGAGNSASGDERIQGTPNTPTGFQQVTFGLVMGNTVVLFVAVVVLGVYIGCVKCIRRRQNTQKATGRSGTLPINEL